MAKFILIVIACAATLTALWHVGVVGLDILVDDIDRPSLVYGSQ